MEALRNASCWYRQSFMLRNEYIVLAVMRLPFAHALYTVLNEMKPLQLKRGVKVLVH